MEEDWMSDPDEVEVSNDEDDDVDEDDEAIMEESPNWDDWVQALMSWSCGSRLSDDEVGAIHQMFLDEINDEADFIIEEFLGSLDSEDWATWKKKVSFAETVDIFYYEEYDNLKKSNNRRKRQRSKRRKKAREEKGAEEPDKGRFESALRIVLEESESPCDGEVSWAPKENPMPKPVRVEEDLSEREDEPQVSEDENDPVKEVENPKVEIMVYGNPLFEPTAELVYDNPLFTSQEFGITAGEIQTEESSLADISPRSSVNAPRPVESSMQPFTMCTSPPLHTMQLSNFPSHHSQVLTLPLLIIPTPSHLVAPALFCPQPVEGNGSQVFPYGTQMVGGTISSINSQPPLDQTQPQVHDRLLNVQGIQAVDSSLEGIHGQQIGGTKQRSVGKQDMEKAMKKLANRLQRANTNSQGMAIRSAAYAKGPDPDLNPRKWKESAPSKAEDTTDGYEHPIPMNNKEAERVLERKRARAEMSYLLPHLHSGWAVDQAILADFGVGAFYQSGEEDIRGASNLKVDDMKTLVEHIRRQIFSEALEVLITHLEQEKAERKHRKKEKKLQKAVAKAQNMQQRKCADSSSSSFESSDGDCEEINMANLRMNWIPEQAVWPDVMPATCLENPLNSLTD